MKGRELTGYPSIDKPWMKYYINDADIDSAANFTIYDNLYLNNKDFPSDPAIFYFGNKIPYSTVFENIDKCVKALKGIGIKNGDIVNLCTAGVPEVIYILFACSRIGAVANFVSPLFTIDQMADRIKETGRDWLFILDAMFSHVKDVIPKAGIKKAVIIPQAASMPIALQEQVKLGKSGWECPSEVPADCALLTWENFISAGEMEVDGYDVPYEKDRPVIMVYSSGTTGASKGILLTNDGINATVSYYQTKAFPTLRGETTLQMIPIWFSTGIILSVIMPMIKGVTVIMEPRYSKENFAENMARYKPNMNLHSTSLWMYLVSSKIMENVDMSDLRYPASGGEKYLKKDEDRIGSFLKQHGCTREMIKGYGMCEFGSTIATSTAAPGYVSKPGGTGYPMKGVMISAFDTNTDKELKYRQRGEIRVSSPARMKGYYNNPKATEAFFKTDERGVEWGCTGDIGYVDEDGEVFILGRMVDSFVNENGKRIFLFDSEDIINETFDVIASKVVDVKHNGKYVLVAHIVVQQDSIEDLNGFIFKIHERCKQALPPDSVPHYYKIREQLPVNRNGKLDVESMRNDCVDGALYIG